MGGKTRKVLKKFDSFDLAKRFEADLINEGADPKFIQVRRKANGFEVVERS